MRSITILGATGSIGASTIDLIRRAPERYRVESISARRNATALAKIAREIGARHAVVADPAAYRELKDALSGSRVEAAAGEDALVEAAQRPADWVMAAISGSAGLSRRLPLSNVARLSRSPTRNVWFAPAACSCAALRVQVPPFFRSTPSTMLFSRRWARAIARMSGG